MKEYTTRTAAGRLFRLAIAVAGLGLFGAPEVALAALGKGHTILIQRGLQIQGMVTKDDVFDLSTYQNSNYTAINWLWESNPSLQGTAPGFPWARWVNDETNMPSGAELPYLSQLVALQLGDEWDLNTSSVRDRAVAWINDVRNQWPNTILYMNNWGGQVVDSALGDFITRAHPDMLSFDTYPFQSDPITHVPNGPTFGSPTNWYGEMRRYRIYAQNAGVPWSIYRQTFHAIEGTTREYRSPSPSEMNLNTFGALAFGATTLIDFTFNTGASNVAPHGSPQQPGYAQQADINRRARNLGKTFVHLTGKDNPLNGTLNGGPATTDIMFVRGQTGDSGTPLTPLPIGFAGDNGVSTASFSEWAADQNDPYIRGWVINGCATRDGTGQCNSTNRGDVIISWFKPLDSSLDDPTDVDDQLYFMITNGYTGPNGTATDYRQRVQINFLGGAGPTIQRLNSDTGQVEFVNLDVIPNSGGRRKLVVELDGGMGELFKFNTGHAFLGTSMALSGDYNGDGQVDGADYVVWRDGLNVKYNQTPYATWRSNFGARLPGSGAAAGAIAIVPEPATFSLLGFVAALLLWGRHFAR